MAQPIRVRNQRAAAAAWRTLLPFFVLLPVLGLLTWWLIGRGLKPLGRLAQSVQVRTPDSLDALPEGNVPEEVRPLVDSLNDLLTRLKSALDVQRAFVGDAAHELRTPLTALLLQTQLVERAVSDGERAAALADLKEGIRRATHTVQQMLTLARQEPDASQETMCDVRLAEVVRESVTEHLRLAEERQIDLGVVQADEAAVVRGDAGALKILLANLIGNALRYVSDGGRVDVSCLMTDGVGCLEVIDNGPGVPMEERERVFDRFYRRGSGSGAGLGLAIVGTIARRHGARVELGDADGGGLKVRVTFPRIS